MLVDGHDLETLRIAGDARRPAIVLLHEGLGSVSTWRDFPSALAQYTRCTVFAYSRYGHGRSPVLAGKRGVDYMHHEAREVLPAVLQAAGIERPVLFGHSDGASIAIIFAAHAPQDAAGLILEAPHVFVEELSVASIAALKRQFQSSGLGTRLARHHHDAERTFYGWNDIWLDEAFRNWNI